MVKNRKITGIILIVILLAVCCGKIYASEENKHWVGTWGCALQLTEPYNLPPDPGLTGNTLRQVVHVTAEGRHLRFKVSNEYGETSLTLNSVHFALSSGKGSIDPDSDIVLTFDGMESVTIPAGQKITSDEFNYDLPALSDVAVTIHFGDTPDNVTGHPGSRTTSYILTGDATARETMPEAAKTDHWYYIEGIEMLACECHRSVITLGDSITDGRGSTTNGNNRWPDNLARRLQDNWTTRNVSLINQGIGGNAVVSGGLGPTAIERFDRDVLDQEGIKWIIVLEGVNDIGGSQDESVADDLIEAYQMFIEKAHSEDLLIYGVPILPFGGSQYDSPMHEAARQEVNDWIRTSGRFDAVIDLDAAVRDPENQSILLEEYDSGDHLHLSVEGYQRMADMIDLELFKY